MIKAIGLCFFFLLAQCTSSWRCSHYRSSGKLGKNLMMMSSNSNAGGAPFGPTAVVVMPSVALLSNNAEKLEVLDDILSAVLDGFSPPVIILDAQEARTLTLQKLLFENDGELYKAKDHLVPEASKVDVNTKTAVVLFSGFTREDIRSSIAAIKSWQGPSSGSFPPLAFALAVPPAVNKPLNELFSEILRDFAEEKQAR